MRSKIHHHDCLRSQVLADVSLEGAQGHADRNNTTMTELPASNPDHLTNLPESKSMSPACLQVKHKSTAYAPETSRLLRALRKPYESEGATLSIGLQQIRKKLNFKQNSNHGDKRPAKRRKITCPCHAHLTIWDNTDKQTRREPWLQKTKICDLVVEDNTSPDSSQGLFIDVKMREPFLVSAQDLKTSREHDGWRLQFASAYFLEIKIIPLGADNAWPPIPILKKLVDHRAARIESAVVEQLQGALLFRYTGLPQVSERAVAHSLFYLDAGNTYETKYAMELDMKWIQGEPPCATGREELLPAWAIDSEEVDGTLRERSFGRIDPRRHAKSTALHPQPRPNRAVKTTTHRSARATARESLVVIYRLPSASRMRDKNLVSFRTIKVHTLSCPLCGGPAFHNTGLLRFHLLSIHHKFNFRLTIEEFSADSTTLKELVFDVEPKTLDLKKDSVAECDILQSREIIWHVPRTSFDLDSHLQSASVWDTINHKPKPAKTANDSMSKLFALNSALRMATGRVNWRDVPPLRDTNFKRRKHRPCKIDNPQPGRAIAYSSISHRPYLAESDESMSETDDEIDDTFLVDKFLEEIDLNARDGTDDSMRALAKRWDRYLQEYERMPHALHLSDAVIRFVRIHKNWFTDSQFGQSDLATQRFFALMTLIDILKYNGKISGEVCEDVLDILSCSDYSLSPQEQDIAHELLAGATERARATEGNSRQSDSSDLEFSASDQKRLHRHCPVCQKEVSSTDSTRVHCSQPTCSQLTQWYHGKCINLSPPKERAPVVEKHAYSIRASTWLCSCCTKDSNKEKESHNQQRIRTVLEPCGPTSTEVRLAIKVPEGKTNRKLDVQKRRAGKKNQARGLYQIPTP